MIYYQTGLDWTGTIKLKIVAPRYDHSVSKTEGVRSSGQI